MDASIVAIAGPNGSGKTTILDAMRQLLGAQRLARRRKLTHYLRDPARPVILRALVTNTPDRRGRVPFEAANVRAPEATLACALVPKADGSVEKRWTVLPGDASLEEVRTSLLEAKRDFFTPTEWAILMEKAGVSKSLMEVIATEQGNIAEISDYTLQALYQKVLEMLGDRPTLEHYQKARENYQNADRRVLQIQGEIAKENYELSRLRRDAELLEEWERAERKVKDLSEAQPAAEHQEDLTARGEAAAGLPGMRSQLATKESQRTQLLEEALALSAEEGRIRGEKQAAYAEEEKARRRWGDLLEAQGRLAGRIEDFQAKKRRISELPEGNLEELREEVEQATRSVVGLELERQRLTRDLEDLVLRVRSLSQGRPVYPSEVEATLKALAEVGVRATLTASTVELTEPKAGDAVEAALGDSRYALIVRESDANGALRIAREHRFPGPICSGEPNAGKTSAGPLRFVGPAPMWLREWAGRVWIEADGSLHDDRGLWLSRPVERILGEEGTRVALEMTTTRKGEVERESIETERASQAAEQHRVVCERRWSQEVERGKLVEDLHTLPSLEEEWTRLGPAVSEAHETQEQWLNRIENLQQQLLEVSVHRRSSEDELARIADQVKELRQSIDTSEEKVRKLDERIRQRELSLPPELLAKAQGLELDSPSTVKRDLDRAQEALARLRGRGERPRETVRAEAENRERNLRELERLLEERERVRGLAREELDLARGDYLRTVNEALQDYRERVLALSTLANVRAEVKLPDLSNDDEALSRAGILVSFAFDENTEFKSLGDPSFSDGQRVLTGLIVLLAMAEGPNDEGGRGGFFIIDEPFTHLSLDRVDHVGRFLRATQAQFIITAPTLPSRAQLDPVGIVIVTRKKKADERFAPLPMVAEA